MQEQYDQKINNAFQKCLNVNGNNMDPLIKQVMTKINEKNQLIFDKEVNIVKKGQKMKGDVFRKIKLTNHPETLFNQVDGANKSFGRPSRISQISVNPQQKELQQYQISLQFEFEDRDQPVTLYFKNMEEADDFQNYVILKHINEQQFAKIGSIVKANQELLKQKSIENFFQKFNKYSQKKKQELDQQQQKDLQKQEEQKKQQEFLRQQELLRQQEEQRQQEELKKQQEEQNQQPSVKSSMKQTVHQTPVDDVALQQQEEAKRQEEQRKIDEQKKQEELRKQLEQKKQDELKRQEELKRQQEEQRKQDEIQRKKKAEEDEKKRQDDLRRKKEAQQREYDLEVIRQKKDDEIKKALKQNDISQTINLYLKDIEISESTPMHQPALIIQIKKNSLYDDSPRVINGQSIMDQIYFQARFDLKLSGETSEGYNFWAIQDSFKQLSVKNFKLDDYIIFEIEDQIQLNDSPVCIQAKYYFYQLYDTYHHGKMHYLIFDFHKSQVNPIFMEFETFQTPSLTPQIENIEQLYDYCYDQNIEIYEPLFSEHLPNINRSLIDFLKEFFQQKETYNEFQQIQQKRYFKNVVVLIHNYYIKEVSRLHFKIYTNLDKIQDIEEQLLEQKDFHMTQEHDDESQLKENYEKKHQNNFSVDDYRQNKTLNIEKVSLIQSLWIYNDEQIVQNLQQLCAEGIPTDFKYSIYSCLGKLYDIQMDISQQIKNNGNLEIDNDKIYFYLKTNTQANSQNQQIFYEQFHQFFDCENQKTYKQVQMYEALKTFNYLCVNFKILGAQLRYGKYMISLVEKISQLIHNKYGCEENENNKISFYEQSIFWTLVLVTFNLNLRYNQIEVDESNQFAINKIIIEDVMFLRSQIQIFFKELYQNMLDLGISVEIFFADALLNFCSQFLNTEMYFRVIDLAFSQIQQGKQFINISLILTLFQKFQNFLIKAKSFVEFKNIFNFCTKHFFNADYMVKCILQFQQKISGQNYQDFQAYIFEKNNYYKIYDQQQTAIRQMILNSQPDGLNLCDIINIIGKHATRQEIIPNEDANQINLEESTAIDYKQVYIKVWKQFNIKSKKGIHLYLHRIVLFWPYNTTFQLDVLQNDEIIISLKIENESDQTFNLYKFIPYVENQNLIFKLYQCGFDQQENQLIKQGCLKVASFYNNTVYQHQVSMNDNDLQNNEDFYDSFLNISCMIESALDNKINNQIFTKNDKIGPIQYCNKVLNIGDLDPKIFDQNRYVEDYLKEVLQNNLNQFNISSIYLPNNYWKFDSIMTEQPLKDIIQNSNLFQNFNETSNLYKIFSNNQKFYFKDFLTNLILNCKGTFKQKINQLYSQFQCFELCQEQKNTINIETVKNFIYYMFDILQIPNKKSEIDNWIDYALYKQNNHIVKAQLKKMNQKIDLTNIFQKSSQYNYLNYGTFDIIFGTQDLLYFLQQSITNSFYPDLVNRIFEYDGSANLIIKYYQSGILKNQEITINSKYQILKSCPIIPIASNESNLEKIFQIHENILNLQNFESTVNFKQFYRIFQSMPFLNDVLIQNEQIFDKTKNYICAQFKFNFQGKTFFKIEYQDKNKQQKQYNHQEYLDNIQKLYQQGDQNIRPINETLYNSMDYLDIFERINMCIKRLVNFMIQKQLSQPFNNNLKNIDFEKYDMQLTRDITPDGLDILSLNDVSQLTSKFYKKINFTVNFKKRETTAPKEKCKAQAKALLRVASDNNKYEDCEILYYHPRNNPATKKSVFPKPFPNVKFFGIKFIGQDDTNYLKKPFEIFFMSPFNLDSIECRPLPEQFR